jgi:hypothetical protein
VGEWRCSFTHSLTSALDGGEWLASRPGRFTPRERTPGTHWTGGWVGPRAVLDAVVKRKISSPRRESNPRTRIVQPVAQRCFQFFLLCKSWNHSLPKNHSMEAYMRLEVWHHLFLTSGLDVGELLASSSVRFTSPSPHRGGRSLDRRIRSGVEENLRPCRESNPSHLQYHSIQTWSVDCHRYQTLWWIFSSLRVGAVLFLFKIPCVLPPLYMLSALVQTGLLLQVDHQQQLNDWGLLSAFYISFLAVKVRFGFWHSRVTVGSLYFLRHCSSTFAPGATL